MNKLKLKEREKQSVEVFKSLYKDFPDGEIVADENQERPDVLVKTVRGNIGIEVTRIHTEALKRDESEVDKVIGEARAIYETKNLPKLMVGVHLGNGERLSKKNRPVLASSMAELVATNVPSDNGCVTVGNEWGSPDTIPYEIHAIDIFRHSSLTQNCWSGTSFGFIREDFISELQQVISSKENLLPGYCHKCIEHWLLIVGENASPSTFFEPSSATLNHIYKSSFNKVFFLELFSQKLSQLKISSAQR